jgi:hypothetical protein
MVFKEAVSKTKELSDAYFPGLQALEETDRNRIRCKNTRRLLGSFNLEKSLRRRYIGKPIWDYGIGWHAPRKSECAIWIEVHSADSGHVEDVLKKVKWLKNWLHVKAPSLNDITYENGFVWIASGAVSLSNTSRQARQLANEGVSFPRKALVLK